MHIVPIKSTASKSDFGYWIKLYYTQVLLNAWMQHKSILPCHITLNPVESEGSPLTSLPQEVTQWHHRNELKTASTITGIKLEPRLVQLQLIGATDYKRNRRRVQLARPHQKWPLLSEADGPEDPWPSCCDATCVLIETLVGWPAVTENGSSIL